jgi:hypothetical protein
MTLVVVVLFAFLAVLHKEDYYIPVVVAVVAVVAVVVYSLEDSMALTVDRDALPKMVYYGYQT